MDDSRQDSARQAARSRLEVRLPAADPAARIEALAQRARLDRNAVQAALDGPAPTDRRGFTDTMRLLQTIWRHL